MGEKVSFSVSVSKPLAQRVNECCKQVGINRSAMLRTFFVDIVREQKLPYGLVSPMNESGFFNIIQPMSIVVDMDAALKDACDMILPELGLNYSAAVTALFERIVNSDRPSVGVIELVDRTTEMCTAVIPVDGKLLRKCKEALVDMGYTMPTAMEHFMWCTIDSRNKAKLRELEEQEEQAEAERKSAEPVAAAHTDEQGMYTITVPLAVTVNATAHISPQKPA